jgi:hypothetical protein
MENNKSNLPGSVKYLFAKGKASSVGNLLPISKTFDLSLIKVKPCKNP